MPVALIRKPNIRIIGQTPPPIGGVTVHTERLFGWLQSDVSVDVSLTSLNANPRFEGKAEIVYSLPVWALRRIFVGFHENIVHYQGAHLLGLIFLAFVKVIHGRRFKLVWSRHGEPRMERIRLQPPWQRWIVKRAFREVDLVFAANPSLVKLLREYGLPAAVQAPFLPPIPDASLTPPDYTFVDEFRKEDFLLGSGAYRVSFDSQGRDIYGLDQLFRAFDQLPPGKFKLLVMVPNMDEIGKVYLQKLTENLLPENRIRVMIVNRPDIDGWAVIGRLNLFIRATITDGDALTVREALLQKIPVVASDAAPRPEGCILYKSADVEDLLERIQDLVTQRPCERVTGATVEPSTYISGFLAEYRKLVKEGSN